MKRSYRIIQTLIISMIIISNLPAIGFGYHIMEMRTSPEFSKGVYPSSLLYQFNFPVPDIIYGSDTEFAFRLDNGIAFRKARQNPVTGEIIATTPELYNYPLEYMSFFDDFCFVFKQGFLNTQFADEDLIDVSLTFGGRFERGYERLKYMSSPEETEGLLFKEPGKPRFDANTPWIGIPELADDRDIFDLNISLGLELNYMQDKITRKNGIKNNTYVRFNPSMFQVAKDNSMNFILVLNKLDAAFTLFSIDQNGKRDTSWLSMVIENSFQYRFLSGTRIPFYVQDTGIWGTSGLNTDHTFMNRTSLTLYGPQINSYDVYPSVCLFFEVGHNTGKLLNTEKNDMSISDTTMSTGVSVEFIILDIAKAFFEYGYIIDDTLDLESRNVMEFGFSIGI